MFEDELFKLNTAVADSLNSIQLSKGHAVRIQQYEYTAKLRDTEKKLEEIAELIRHLGIPATPGNSKTGGELFFKQLFVYAEASNWVIPNVFTEALLQRKIKQNQEITFSDRHTAHLSALNKKLKGEEERIIEFLNFLKYVISVKALDITIKGSLTIECCTKIASYSYPPHNADEENPFYHYTFPVNDLLNGHENYYKTDKALNTADNEFLKPFPLKLRDENICFLFYVLAKGNVLSFSDLLNISKIEVALDAKYGFGENEISLKEQ